MQEKLENTNFYGKNTMFFFIILKVSDSSGQVKYFRNIDSHFLSSQECITAGSFQNKFANTTKLSSNGKHGSKFVTVCVTGSKDKQVHMEGYQVSFFISCMQQVQNL